MSNDGYSRRNFLRNMAAGSSGAALASLPLASPEAKADAAAGPPTPVTVESYPLADPTAGAAPALVKIVTQDDLPDPYWKKLRGASSNVEVKRCGSGDEFRREVGDAHVIYGEFSREDLQAAKQLKWIQYTAAGVEHILWPELVESPIVLTNMQRIYSPTISETAIGLMLTLARGLNGYALQTREQRWDRREGLREISSLTVGMVGLGGIGTDTAYRAHYGFHMRILAVDPKPIPKPGFVAELHSLDWLPQMVPQVDILMCAAPHTPLSQGMFNTSIFRAMQPTAFFINMSRGKLVHTPALVQALKEGWIAGAGLDVTDPEPLPSDHPLWTAGNVIITCHSSAESPGSEQRAKDLFAENLRRYIAGLPLLNVVDKKRGY